MNQLEEIKKLFYCNYKLYDAFAFQFFILKIKCKQVGEKKFKKINKNKC